MNFVDLIGKKRDGLTLSYEELATVANGAATGAIPDYQLSAWLMAAFLNPLDEQETAWLTKAMAESGARIDLTGLPKPWVDKHSTGGVGDKTTLVLLPILAACGLTVVKMSGRGLGITGGTIDKLSAIPGFRLDLSPEEMKAQAAEIGVALTGQSPNLAPADKALYALRDVTGTVGSIPLIVSSILSKKIAGGADTIVLDVKCGSGAFMETPEDAQKLAAALVETGRRLGLAVKASISDMAQPLGSMVGNALEVKEAYDVLKGQAPNARFQDLCVYYTAETLEACGKVSRIEDGKAQALEVLESGKALKKFKEWVRAQEGDAFWDSGSLPEAAVVEPLRFGGAGGYVQAIDARAIGQAVIDLGGGRKRKDDQLDLSVGVEILVRVGQQIREGTNLAKVHASSLEKILEVGPMISKAFTFSDTPVQEPPLILGSF